MLFFLNIRGDKGLVMRLLICFQDNTVEPRESNIDLLNTRGY